MYLSLFVLSLFFVFINCMNFVVGQLFVGSIAVSWSVVWFVGGNAGGAIFVSC